MLVTVGSFSTATCTSCDRHVPIENIKEQIIKEVVSDIDSCYNIIIITGHTLLSFMFG